MDPTSKFLNARPYAVLPALPALAALYASQSPQKSDWCSKCGSYLLDGTAEMRTLRRKQKRVLRSACRACGERRDILIMTSPDLDPRVQKKPTSAMPISSTPSSQSPSLSNSAQAQQGRNKKKSALQFLLAQHRDRPTSVRKDAAASDLTAFLAGL